MKTKKYIGLLLTLISNVSMAQSTTENYVKTETMLDDTGTKCVSAVQYYNGLGYPTVAVSTVGTNGQTAATMTTYDAHGREERKYVPVPGSGLNYIKESTFKSSGYYYQDNSIFTQNHYDALDRVTAVDIAGDKWRKAGKQNKTEYLANSEGDNVRIYKANPDGKFSLQKTDKYYPAGSLTKEVSIDADNKKSETYKDFFGNIILQRMFDGNTKLDTYYVYDDLNRLCYVLSPQYQKTGTKAINCYEYRYDNKGRIVKKILPGCKETQYWYDNTDRVICMQDAVLRAKSLFRFYMYDNIGRLVIQGLYPDWNFNSAFFKTNNAITTYDGSRNSTGLLGTGYSVPSKFIQEPSKVTLEIVNYYDNYDFMGKNMITAMPTTSTIAPNSSQEQYAIGSQTGSVVYTSSGEALGSINLYDQKGQVVRSVRKGLGGYVEDVNTEYTFTGAIDNTTADVTVKYGNHFIAKTDYTYGYGKKTKMSLSVSHGNSPLSRSTEYSYDFTGRLSTKKRQLSKSYNSYCSYSYDVHGWLTYINSGDFREWIYYADGLDGNSCYNGNISTIKWQNDSGNLYHAYNMQYDDLNRLKLATYSTDYNSLNGSFSSNKNYFNEWAEYDYNGNITRLQRGGLVNMYGGFGLVDDLYMSYLGGNQLTTVRDNATHPAYNGATDFYTDSKTKSYALTYNEAGSLVSDASRKIAMIEYDNLNNPVRIQFMDGSITKYIYSATGEKLRVTYQTAVPNISVAIGKTRELSPSEIRSTNYTDYLLGGSLTLVNGRIDKYQFEEGYCQAEKSSSDKNKDNFTFCYYDQDHLGNIRQVREANGSKGTVIQTMNYYPFGAEFCDNTTKNNVQNHKYNGKEFDNMHGLNSYDYGARQYNPVTARWDRIDPLSEKYYSHTPYGYCRNNPIIRIDVDGLYDTLNIKKGENYPVIVVLSTTLDDAGKDDYKAAKNASMPILLVDDIDDLKNALSELGDAQTTFDCVTLNSHGSIEGFFIGSDKVDLSTDLSTLEPNLKGKDVVINACKVGINDGLTGQIAEQTGSTVYASKHRVYAGYSYNGAAYRHLNSKKTGKLWTKAYSEEDSGFKFTTREVVKNLSIHKTTGVKYKRLK